MTSAATDDDELEGGQAFVHLNVDNPVVAWTAGRGVLLSARQIANDLDGSALPISFMMARLLEYEGAIRYHNELLVEEGRRKFGPKDTSSRLWGMFCFPDLESARRASTAWGAHFLPENLVTVALAGVGLDRRFDSNWLTHAPRDASKLLDRSRLDWLEPYWKGEPYRGRDPIWECVVDGKLTILGTKVRQRGYEFAAKMFPDATTLLEFGRIAAWNGFKLGNISPFLIDEGDAWRCRYYMDMTEANDERLHNAFEAHVAAGQAVNHAFLKHFMETKGELGATPDLTPWSFGRRKV